MFPSNSGVSPVQEVQPNDQEVEVPRSEHIFSTARDIEKDKIN